ncbi:hypothetical protein, partial [Paenibacillus sp.]|uniref:hypothetical protein n=1 Tax=Paenibacillus sp. TaxID=58172 RepID=UPI002D756A81
ALGPMSQPSRPAPSCTGAPRMMHAVDPILLSLSNRQASEGFRRIEQPKLTNGARYLIKMASYAFHSGVRWTISTSG